ncbi:MAG TPA: hypothetical protein VN898_01645, partial [Candidatus Binatia bacterium]|nr:hypothetical protein [Candidatus Binatia bacterium]
MIGPPAFPHVGEPERDAQDVDALARQISGLVAGETEAHGEKARDLAREGVDILCVTLGFADVRE